MRYCTPSDCEPPGAGCELSETQYACKGGPNCPQAGPIEGTTDSTEVLWASDSGFTWSSSISDWKEDSTGEALQQILTDQQ